MPLTWIAGPWIWDTSNTSEPHWRPPAGFSGLDARTLAEQAQVGGTPGMGIFVGQVPLAAIENRSDYGVLGQGSWYDVKPNALQKSRIPRRKGFNPNGGDLVGMLLSAFTEGASPDGSDGPKPLVPTTDGNLELCMWQKHSERFRWGGFHTNILRQSMRADFARMWQEAQSGVMRDQQQPRRVLSMTCEKFGIDDWREFVPQALQKDVPGTLPHETTVSDSFTRADSTGLGASWGNVFAPDFDVVSNQARAGNGTSLQRASSRYESNLSSADHYSQNDIVRFEVGGGSCGACARFQSTDETFYCFILRTGSSPYRRVFKFVSATPTLLSSDTTLPSATATIRITVNGSSITADYNGSNVAALSATDSSITGNLRCGMYGAPAAATTDRSIQDNFTASDIAASGILYTQLERSTRGICRGMYTRF